MSALLRSGQDKPLKSKGSRTKFTPEQDEELSRIVKLSACDFHLNGMVTRFDLNNDPIYADVEGQKGPVQ